MPTTEAHTYQQDRLEPGVYPEAGNRHEHFSLVGVNGRQAVVLDCTGLIDFAGVEVVNPEHLRQFAARINRIADVLEGNLARRTPPPVGAGLCERCAQWEADAQKHQKCPKCGQPWAQIVTAG